MNPVWSPSSPTTGSNPAQQQQQPHQPQQSSTAAELAAKARARRPKAQLSCVPCRQKKQRCDRARPCRNCSKINPTRCIYVNPTPLSQTRPRSSSPERGRSGRVYDRLQLLESRIAQLASQTNCNVTKQSSSGLSAAIDPSHDLSGPRLAINQEDTRFISPSHWEGILSEIAGIKEDLAYKSPGDESEAGLSIDIGPRILFGCREDISHDELISALPAKTVADALLRMFTQKGGMPPLVNMIIHLPTFVKEYEAFWEDPDNSSLSWISILYSVLALSLQNALRLGRPVEGILIPETSCKMYTVKAVQCLIKSDYAKPVKYTMEALMFYLSTEQFWMEKEHYRAGLAYGIIVRVAQRMGYHRDPSHYPHMSIFEAEMQRRRWAMIIQLDLFLAGKCGLPSLVRQSSTDTSPPLNLLDEDLSPDMLEHPKPRPDAEFTPVGYMNYKTRLLIIQGRVLDRMSRSDVLSYEEILHLEGELVAEVSKRPSALEPPHDSQAVRGPPLLLGALIDADIIVQRARMVLHRKLIIAAQRNPRYSSSRDLALDAAKKALMYQSMLYHTSSDPSGRAKELWRFLSLLNHDFLLGAMVLCLDINQDLQPNKGASLAHDGERRTRIAEHLNLLCASYDIWKACAETSSGAQEGHDILRSMIEKFEDAQSTLLLEHTGQPPPPPPPPPHPPQNLSHGIDAAQIMPTPLNLTNPPHSAIPMHPANPTQPICTEPVDGLALTHHQSLPMMSPPMPQSLTQQAGDWDQIMIDDSMMNMDWAGWDPNFYGSVVGMFQV